MFDVPETMRAEVQQAAKSRKTVTQYLLLKPVKKGDKTIEKCEKKAYNKQNNRKKVACS
ncbi:hypothetical protein [Lactococcus garvieae]|uniref:hypothetical protein n=1 Tax=Lactococcus garvieae TaxID=1363 RepID=UPI00254C7FBE|nr:hypothetical protein [Lactococcus garvieae]